MKFTGVIYQSTGISDVATFERLPGELQNFISEVNGIVAFNGGLQIRGCVTEPSWISLNAAWSDLYKTYDCLTKDDIPFAQDAFGDQFVWCKGQICRLNAEFGELDNLELSFSSFIQKVLDDPIEFLMLEPFVQLYGDSIRLKPGELMNVYPPFMFETKNSRSFKPVSVEEQIEFLKSVYQQTKDLSDGEKIKIVIE